ncbi:MAG: hypothetical protein ACLPHI_02705 [Terriglobales bacterium]|jgi:hypothetical protein
MKVVVNFPRNTAAIARNLPYNSRHAMEKASAQSRKRNKGPKTAKFPLDRVSEKRPGRREKIGASEVVGRAHNYRWILNQVWDRLWPLLSKAKNEEDVIKAFREGAKPYDGSFVPSLAGLVLKVMNERKFPKRKEPRIHFLADSLAGVGLVTPRRSRDICEEERANAKKTHHIVCYEFYVECSCGYKGRSKKHACTKCGARISFGANSNFNSALA